jgi:hypothetical protein
MRAGSTISELQSSGEQQMAAIPEVLQQMVKSGL